MSDRLQAIEEKLLALEHHVEQLDTVVRDAFVGMDKLQREIERLRSDVAEMQTNMESSGEEEPPPPHSSPPW
ncbi:MAG: SlyX family protein [Planctomycetota bacterium]